MSIDPENTRTPAELERIGLRLRALREERELSQREVAEAVGLPQSNLSRIENGKQRLNLPLLAKMLSSYQLTIQEFFSSPPGPGTALEGREARLLASFRRLPAGEQREVEDYVDYKLFQARRERPRRPCDPE